MSFGAVAIEYVNNGQIAQRVFSAKDGGVLHEAAGLELRERFAHAVNGSAEHGLHGIRDECVFDWDDEVDVLNILFQPALNAGRKLVHALEHQRAFCIFVEGDDHVAAKVTHGGAKVAARAQRKQITMERLARERARYRAV